MILRRINTPGGTKWLRRAIALAKSVVPKFGQKTEIIDGYLVRGKRVADTYVAEVLDSPAWLLVVGRISVADMSWVPNELSLMLEFPEGRDGFVGLGRIPEYTTQAGVYKYVFATMHKDHVVGTLLDKSVFLCISGRPAQFVPALGVAHGYTLVTQPAGVGNVNPFAFIGRGEQVRYFITLHPPQVCRMYAELVDREWQIARVPDPDLPMEDTPIPGTLSLIVTDDLMRSHGAMPFCLKVDPPPYDAGASGAYGFHEAQSPWHDFVVEYRMDDEGQLVYRAVVWASAVVDMLSDVDRYGAKGLWVATIEVMNREATVLSHFMVDTSTDPNPLRRPWATGESEYAYNAHLRGGGALLDSGTVVILDPFQVSAPESEDGPVNRYSSVDLHWIARDGAKLRTVTILNAFLARQPHDMRCPTGVATDGVEVIAPVLSTPFRGDPCGFDVICATEDGAEVIFSTTVPFYPCVSGIVGSHFTTGRLDGNHWEAMGAGDRRVCYIGNGKYLFYVSTTVGTSMFASGDWGVAIFDRKNLSVQLGGVIDPTLRGSGYLVAVGQPVCLVPEVELEDGAIRKATVLATRGGPAQHENHPGIEVGSTWVSYDSGETWEQLVNVGSPGGVYYCGNILAAAAGGQR